MFFWQNKKHTWVLFLLDIILVAVAFFVAYWCKSNLLASFSGLSNTPDYTLVLFLLILTSCCAFYFFHINTYSFRENIFKKILMIWVAVGSSVIALIILLFILHHSDVSRLLLGLHWIFASILCSLRLIICHKLFLMSGKNGKRSSNILIIGSRQRAQETIRTILDAPGSFYNIIGCLEIDPEETGNNVLGDISIIGDMRIFKHILLNTIIDDVIFAVPLKKIPNINEQITFAEKLGVRVLIMPDWQIQKIMFQPEAATISFENFAGIPCLSLSSTPEEDGGLLVKSFIDLSVSSLGIILISPLLLTIAALVKLDSKGPVFFSQERMGLNGRRFMVHKFRTMVVNAEELRSNLAQSNEMDGPVFKIKNDPRITRLGRFLRKSSLDELPQLFNVLRGEMSLVGPRPPIPKEVDEYLPCQRRRLSMRPGITCIWQVSGRNNVDFEQWMKMDLKYIDEWSPWLDTKIFFLTIRAVASGSGS